MDVLGAHRVSNSPPPLSAGLVLTVCLAQSWAHTEEMRETWALSSGCSV